MVTPFRSVGRHLGKPHSTPPPPPGPTVRWLTDALEGRDLRSGFFAALFLEEHVVGGAGVERRVEVDQVHAGVWLILAEDFQIVAEIEFVRGVQIGESITQVEAAGVAFVAMGARGEGNVPSPVPTGRDTLSLRERVGVRAVGPVAACPA
jgi:hypothetical protein